MNQSQNYKGDDISPSPPSKGGVKSAPPFLPRVAPTPPIRNPYNDKNSNNDNNLSPTLSDDNDSADGHVRPQMTTRTSSPPPTSKGDDTAPSPTSKGCVNNAIPKLPNHTITTLKTKISSSKPPCLLNININVPTDHFPLQRTRGASYHHLQYQHQHPLPTN